jgi:hypothetical protein
MLCRVGRPQILAVGPTRLVAPRDTVPPSGAAEVSFPAVPDPTGQYTAAQVESILYCH